MPTCSVKLWENTTTSNCYWSNDQLLTLKHLFSSLVKGQLSTSSLYIRQTDKFKHVQNVKSLCENWTQMKRLKTWVGRGKHECRGKCKTSKGDDMSRNYPKKDAQKLILWFDLHFIWIQSLLFWLPHDHSVMAVWLEMN